MVTGFGIANFVPSLVNGISELPVRSKADDRAHTFVELPPCMIAGPVPPTQGPLHRYEATQQVIDLLLTLLQFPMLLTVEEHPMRLRLCGMQFGNFRNHPD